jgi:hypothetical protein
MGHLTGLKEYLDLKYENSVFDGAMASGKSWVFQIHGRQSITAVITGNDKWALMIVREGKAEEELQKIEIKYLYPADTAAFIEPLVKTDKKVEARGLEPIYAPGKRHFVKNKTLFPLMKDREVLFFTMLEGEIIRGIVGYFSRYDITVSLKGGRLLTVLRHGIYDVRNKRGRSFLKSFQEEHRDWERNTLYVSG